MSLQTRRELFELVSKLNIPEDTKNEYLKYLLYQHPVVNAGYIEMKDNYTGDGRRSSVVTCFDENYPLKSFFHGKEGVNIIYNENGCFEDYILENLPEQYSPCKGLSGLRFGLKDEIVIIPEVSFQPSVDVLVRSESFSLHEMLCIFIEGIKMTEKHFLRKKEFANNSEAIFDMMYKPSEPFFSISGECTYCRPRENGKFMQRFSVYYDSKKKAWGINYYNAGD